MKTKGDLYIMLPCIQIDTSSHNEYIIIDNNAELFLKELYEVAKYEFTSSLNDNLERSFLSKIRLVCKTDDRNNPIKIGEQDAFVTITKYIDFYIINIIVVDVSVSLTHLLDQVSRRELIIIENNKEVSFNKWINKFGFEPTGKAFFASFLSSLNKEDKEANYIIAAEAFNNQDKNFIKSEMINTLLNKNHQQYSSYDAYMSECGITVKLNELEKDNDYSERLKTECLIIFIMELVILKITAINAANNDIIAYFSKEDISKNEINSINEQFSKSLSLWNINHFNYLLAREFANRVETAFKVNKFINVYEKNRIFLEQLINSKKMIIAENEESVFRKFAIVLSILQTIPFLNTIFTKAFEGIKDILHILVLIISFVLILILIILLFRKKKNEQKKNLIPLFKKKIKS